MFRIEKTKLVYMFMWIKQSQTNPNGIETDQKCKWYNSETLTRKSRCPFAPAALAERKKMRLEG